MNRDQERPTAYKIIDRRTGKRVSEATYGPLWLAHATIVGWRVRDRRGKRPDVHDLIPHLACAIETRGRSEGEGFEF